MRFAIHGNKLLTEQTRRTVDELVQLTKASTERKLKPAESKRLARVQTQLLRASIISPVTQELVRKRARALYHSLPWWKKLRLKVGYYISARWSASKPSGCRTASWTTLLDGIDVELDPKPPRGRRGRVSC